jgi:protein-L-isoaspartate(D-aspartate) O-methyltransferase
VNSSQRERLALVRSLERKGIRDARILEAIGRVPRERFVPPLYADAAYEDRALPIGEGQTISQPWVVARMTQLLAPEPWHHALEIGTGSGYQAAVLAQLVADLVTVERHAALAAQAARLLRELGHTNVAVIEADGSTGYEPAAPYDRIIVTAAASDVDALATQLRPAGRLVAPVGEADLQYLMVKHADGTEEVHEPVRFVPLVSE